MSRSASPRIRIYVVRTLVAAAAVVASWTPEFAQSQCEGIAPVSQTALKTVVVAQGLDQPLLAVSPPGDLDRIFIVEQDGRIVLHRRGDAPTVNTVFLDVRDRVDVFGNEMGLLGLTFDPDFASTGRFYVNYTEGTCPLPPFCCGGVSGSTCHTVVSRFDVSATDPDAADPTSEARLMRFQQPQTNHNGGLLTFGNDGFLYIFTGDGGGSGDAHGSCGNGQDLTTLLGKILRIDVAGVDPAALPAECDLESNYTIPSENPLVSGPSGDCDEIWSYGLRNPWRSAFDPDNGDLYIADVGQNSWEEISYARGDSTGGENYGWRVMEGSSPFNQTCDTASCSSFICPIKEYANGGADCSITGGFVYRGCLMPGLRGNYFYGDFCSGFVRTLRVDRDTHSVVPGSEQDLTAQLDPSGELANGLTSFGLDGRGELFILDRDVSSGPVSGRLLKMLPIFPDLIVSGAGAATPFLLGSASWTWENTVVSTEHPVSSYRIYRGQPNADFSCVFSTTDTEWVGGDPAAPSSGNMFAYLVTAVSPQGDESSPGDPRAARNLLPGGCP